MRETAGYFKQARPRIDKRAVAIMTASIDTPSGESIEDILNLAQPFREVSSRGISERVCKALGIRTRVDEFGDTVAWYFPYYKLTDGEPILVGFKRKTAANAGGKSSYTTIGMVDANCLLFGAVIHDKTTGRPVINYGSGAKRRIVITEGEFDCAACMEAALQFGDSKYGYPAFTSIGLGTVNAVQHISARVNKHDYLTRFTEPLVIAFDNDGATPEQYKRGVRKGQEALKAVVDYLGEASVAVCTMPLNYDPNQMLVEGMGRDLYWAYTKPAKYAVDGFIDYSQIRHKAIQMPELGRPFPWDSLTKLTLGRRPGEGFYFGGAVKAGKCFGAGTKIRMFDGSVKRVEDIVIGDVLLGDDSTPRTVLETHSGKDELYCVSQKYGSDYVVNGEHILVYKDYKHGEVHKPVNELLGISNIKTNSGNMKTFHTSVEYPEKPIPICPYTLGVWLGDGSRSDERICLNSEDAKLILPFCKETISLFKSSKIGCHEGSILGKGAVLREFGGIKYIPQYILTNSKDVRRKLLAGLIDTDGSKSKGSKCSYQLVTKYQQLAETLYELCRSLGLKVSVNKVTKGIKSSGFLGEYYSVLLSGDLREIPIQVDRKKCEKPYKDATKTYFKINAIGVGNYYGFETDGNHLFCLEDYSVVHNSELLNQMVEHIIHTEESPPAVFKFEEEPHITCKKIAGKLARKQFTNPEKMVLYDTSGREVDVWGQPIPAKLRSSYFTEQELVSACEDLGDKVIYYNNYGAARWDDVAEKIRYAVTVLGCKDVFIDPLTRLTAGMEAAEANTELERIADEISTLSKDLGFTYYIFCHLKAPSQGKPHEKGGKVESYQFTGSRAMMRACYYMLGLERNKSDELPEIARNMSNLVLLEDRAFGRTGRVCLFYDKDTGEYREPTYDEVKQYEHALEKEDK